MQSRYFSQKNDGAAPVSAESLRNRWDRPDSNGRPSPCKGSSGCDHDTDASQSRNQLDHEPALSYGKDQAFKSSEPTVLVPQVLSELALPFTLDELLSYAERRKFGLSTYSIDWINRAWTTIWDCTNGSISKTTIDKLRLFGLKKYHSEDSHIKLLSFAKAFLKFLTKSRLDTRYYAFEVILERPRAVKARNNATSRIITKTDIENVLAYIDKEEKEGELSHRRAQHYRAFIVFGAYTGQRSLATMAKLTVGQFREALRSDKPCVEVQSSQDKIKMQHYVPLHPQVIQAIQPLLEARGNDEPLFEYISLLQWVKRAKIPLTQLPTHFTLGDLRKWCQQMGDIIQWPPTQFRVHAFARRVECGGGSTIVAPCQNMSTIFTFSTGKTWCSSYLSPASTTPLFVSLQELPATMRSQTQRGGTQRRLSRRSKKQ